MTGDDQLKVLMIAPTPYFADRGCHVRIYEEARALIARGHDVRIVTYHLGRDLPGIDVYRIPRVPWYKKLTAGPSWQKPFLDILLFFRTLQIARQFKPHLLHAHLHEGAFVGLFARKILRIPLLFDCQGSLTTETIDHGFITPDSIPCKIFHFLEKKINRHADFIITSSGEGARGLVDTWGTKTGRVLGLIDGVDCDGFHPQPPEAPRRELQLPTDRPIIVFLGVLNQYQGVDLLLDAVAQIRRKGVPVHLLVMGFPEERYRGIAEQAGIGDCVTFTGRIDYARAAFYLSAGDIAVSPKISLSEANGKLFNYMACALPTVVFDTPVNREIMGDAALYAVYADTNDFAAKIETLLRDEHLRKELGLRARERAECEHSWATRGRELEGIYRKILM